MLARLCGGASGSVTTIAIAKSAPTAPEVNHLWPLMTHSPSLSSAREWMLVGSEPDVSGSVIEKQLRWWPFSTGSRNFSFCSGVPCSCRISMLPVSGAEQLKTMGDTRLRPMTSQSIPYSQLVRPTPISSSGMKRFQRPSAFAFSRSSMTASG